MHAYRSAWWFCAGVLALIGCVLAVFQLPVPALAVTYLGCAAAGGSLWAIEQFSAGQQRPSWSVLRLRSCWRMAAAAGAGGLGVAGMIATAGMAGLGLTVIVAGSSPPVVGWVAGRLPSLRPAPLSHPDTDMPIGTKDAVLVDLRQPGIRRLPSLPDEPVEHCSTEELCRAWRASYTALQHGCTSADLTALADRRRRYLDEIERRDPAGYARWMASGARAGSDPARFLTQGRKQDSA